MLPAIVYGLVGPPGITFVTSMAASPPRSQAPTPAAAAAVRDRLRQARFLDGLTDSALHQLAKLVRLVVYENDVVLFQENHPREFMAILASGSVAIEKDSGGRVMRLVTLGSGEAVGEGL